MLAYHDSVSVSALLAKVIGFWSCSMVAPRPVVEASAWGMISFVGLEYPSVVSAMIAFLTLSNTS